jgi:hypothetical protein
MVRLLLHAQTYIVSELIYDRLATRMDITIISFSLFISSINVVKYTWKFRKAARQAGMNFWVSACHTHVRRRMPHRTIT